MTKKIFLTLIYMVGSHFSFCQTDSTSHTKNIRVIKHFIAPAALVATGLYTRGDGHLFNRYSVRDYRNDNYPTFSTHADDFLLYSPVVAVAILDFFGIEGKNNLCNQALLLAKSELIMLGTTQSLKQITHELRPDNSDYHSFPSGHTAQAFAAATFLHKEFGKKSIWVSIGSYTIATSVGLMRVLNNRHWISDVLAGAGLGILSTQIIYLTHQYKWCKNKTLAIVPFYNRTPGLSITWAIR